MSHEAKERPNYLVERIENLVSVPAIQLYTDPQKFNFYMDILKHTAGEPYKAPPKIERDRGAGMVTYDMEELSAMTDDGSHFIEVRTGHSKTGFGLTPVLQYDVTTFDFESYASNPLYVSEVVPNITRSPRTELVLSHQPVHEAEASIEIDGTLPLLDRALLRGTQKIARARKIEKSIRYLHEHQRSYFSWGNGSPMQTLHSRQEIWNDLLLLSMAEQRGLLARETRSHEAVREYLGQAA